jgi:competence protein ComEC
MRTGIVALALGLVTLRWLPVLPPVWLIVGTALGGLALICTRARPLGLFLLGLGWACGSAQWALLDRLDPSLDGRTLWVEGVVTGLPEPVGQGTRFEFHQVRSRHAELPARLRLTWRDAPPIGQGERWRLAVTLKRPHGLANPGGFDYEAWLLSRRIGATGSVKDGQRLVATAPGWRDALRTRLAQVDAQGREALLAALVLGDRSGIERQDWDTLQATGTVHLLVISGQHIGLLAGLVYGAVAGLARLGVWPVRWPWLPWACTLAFGAALAYGALAGFQVPVRRACLMLGMVLCWRLRYRQLLIGWPLLVALVIVLVIEPLASLQSGFWLSFGAVAVLLLVFSARLGRWRWWRAWTRAQWLIALGLLPALLALNLPISLSGPLANLLAVPLISLAVLPLALLGTALLVWPMAGEALLWLAGGLLEGLFEVLQALARMAPPWMPGSLPAPLIILVGIGALLLLLPAGVPLRPLGWPLLLLAVFPPRPQVAHGEAEVWQLDVGQGLAMIVRTRQHVLVYDAGPRSPGFDAGEQVVLPVLRRLGARHVDLLVVSHAHADHAGGALAVANGTRVRRVIGGEVTLDRRLQAQPCTSGERWEWDGVVFSTWRWAGARDSNSASCVLRIQAGEQSLLLTGDIEADAERALVASGWPVDAQWLQAPHHGSRTSSSPGLLQAVGAQGVLISRGHGNRFGHPHPQVIARYQGRGMVQYDTALHGALRLNLGRYAKVSGHRQSRRFWREAVAFPVHGEPGSTQPSTRLPPMVE